LGEQKVRPTAVIEPHRLSYREMRGGDVKIAKEAEPVVRNMGSRPIGIWKRGIISRVLLKPFAIRLKRARYAPQKKASQTTRAKKVGGHDRQNRTKIFHRG